MEKINEIRNLTNELMSKDFNVVDARGKQHILNAKNIGYVFEFHNKKRAFGTCYYNKKVISLSLPLCRENLDKIHTNIRNTILHEIAHAFSFQLYGSDGRGHDYKWKHIAKQIGCDGERCFNGEEVNRPQSKYSLVCDNCGYTSPKYKIIKKQYACSKCCNQYNGGRYSEKYKLRFVQNFH
jgi:predicted SprT family Zn-dependent metalloprotease